VEASLGGTFAAGTLGGGGMFSISSNSVKLSALFSKGTCTTVEGWEGGESPSYSP